MVSSQQPCEEATKARDWEFVRTIWELWFEPGDSLLTPKLSEDPWDIRSGFGETLLVDSGDKPCRGPMKDISLPTNTYVFVP